MSKAKRNRSNEDIVYHLGPEHEGLTLSGALKQLMPDRSWGHVKNAIAKRQVTVNGNLCLDEARRLSARDVVKYHEQPLARPVEQRDVRIAHLDEHLLVVEKPAGITTVRHFQERKLSTRRRQVQPTLEEMLPPLLAKLLHLRWPPLPPPGMNRGKRQTNRNRGRERPGHIQNLKKIPAELQIFPVHRLDRDTSGLMLFARTRAAEQRLVSMFRRHTIHREYLAVCQGTIQPQTIRSLMVRDRGDGVRGSLAVDHEPSAQQFEAEAALEAVTHIVDSQPLSGGQYSLVRCKLETGRTHQIRIHLSEAGHPVCGDKIYHRRRDGTLLPDTSLAPRQALHSDRLEFTHPFTGEHLSFHMPLSKDLATWFQQLTATD